MFQRPIQIELSEQEREKLSELANGRREQQRIVERAKIILKASDGLKNYEIARSLGITVNTVRKWRKRYFLHRLEHPQSTVIQRLTDAQRPGCPAKFDTLFWVDVLSIATSDPQESGRPVTEWTQRELAEEVVERGLANAIHPTTIGRFLAECDLQPHRVEGWMNRKEDPEFDNRASDIKDCLVKATSKDCPADEIIVSFDEKTGMQAKERIAEDKPMQTGRPKRLEFEYERHGTLVLFSMMLVNLGTILGCTYSNRSNVVTAYVLKYFFEQIFSMGYRKIHVTLDQLNTHWSKELIEVVASLCCSPIPFDFQIKTGEQRRFWLSSPDKSIVFHFTPKHASWLNPIEIWFGVLARRLLRHGSFCSTEDLADQVARFILYYNTKMAHPYQFKRWMRRA